MGYLQRVATNLKNTKPAKPTTGPMLAQAIFMTCVAMIFALSLTVVFANPSSAIADDEGSSGDYSSYSVTNVDKLLGGDKGWNSNLIKEVDSSGGLDNASGSTIASQIGDFLHILSVMIVTVALVGSVARLGGRAACEILGINFFSSDNTMNPTIKSPAGKQYGLAAFFLTAEERDSKKQLTILQNPKWFSQMAMETVVFLLIALGTSALLSLAAGIATAFLGQAGKAFNTDWGAQGQGTTTSATTSSSKA